MKDKAVFAEMLVQHKPIRFQVDCGADANILPHKHVENVDLAPCSPSLVMWNGTKVKPVGTCALPVVNPRNNTKYKVRFVVVKKNLTLLLGLNATEKMGFLTVHKENFVSVVENLENDLVIKYADVFDEGLGKQPGKVHLQVDPASQPVILPARKVLVSVREKFKAELQRLQELEVVAPVDEPTEWVSQFVFAVKKCGELRVCIDPKALNAALKRERYQIPVIDDLLPDLAEARVFTKVDLASAFWHSVLDDESSLLTTFATPHGRYRCVRLPFGLCVSSEIFQKHLHQELLGLPGVKCIADDLLIYGKDDADHDCNLEGFIKRCQLKGIKLNRAKLDYRCKEVPFHGHLLTTEDLKPDPQRFKAITEMPRPEKPEDVSRLNEKAWNEVKSLIASAPVLSYYKPDELLEVQCDSSQAGLGAVLMQGGQPLAQASRTLTETESRYAQIEKEMLAIVFEMEKSNDYTFGRKTVVFSNYKPLESIPKKPLHRAPKRLQGMIIRLQKYDLEPVPDNELCQSKLEWRKQRQAQYYNSGAVDLNPLKRGDPVRIKPFQLGKREWQKGIVRSRLDEKTYEVETPHDVVRRNRVHQRKTNEPSPTSSDGPAEMSMPSSMQSNEVPTTVPEEVDPPLSTQGNTSLTGPEVPSTTAKSPQKPSLRRYGRQ
ncbi:Retrovirus-related Pol polyprotein from transposon 17.6 [Stylophora pistillata]|uniref:Retrovirus-related Pol polyprotein from transposon 17.6 n=1 Tax=Stylophora pistillata TaxID=50429 RepID=A0A2B4SRL3_STYPI|nr:Retrovirus-related Pol polyprotein from transposon 17.6 [Stylophora pistillata]